MSNTVPEGWSYQPLSDLAFIDRDSLKSSTDRKYQFRYVDIASVSTGRVELPTNYTYFEDSPSRARKRVRKGDVLMSTVRPNLKAFAFFNASGDDYVASTGFAVICAKDGNDGKFLFNTILSDDVTRQIESLVVGSNYPAINSSDVRNLEILTPTKFEQKKIAAILTSVDEVIEKTQAQIDKLKALKTGMMQELLTKGIGPDGRPHTEFKDSPIGRIPVGWDVKPLSDLMISMTNGFVGSATKHYSTEGIPYLMSKNVRNNKLDLRGLTFITHEFHEQCGRSMLEEGDLLTVQSGHIGTSAVVPKKFHGANCHALIVSKPKRNLINCDYYAYLFNSTEGRNRLSAIFVGSTIPHINTSDLKKFLVPVPPKNEQADIVAALASVDLKIDSITLKMHHQKQIKKALMQDLLTGKVRVTVDS